MSPVSRLVAHANAPIDAVGLAVFRVLFGLVMVVDFVRYFIAGWIDQYFIEPSIVFTYPGFSWVQPLPRVWMFVVFIAVTVAALGVMLGAWYRVSAWALVVGHGYSILLAATHYLNHAYLLELVAILMACVPAARCLSVDAWRRPKWRRAINPAWSRGLLLAQFGVVYVFGGIAKLNQDWLAGEPIGTWLRHRARTTPAWLGELLSSELAVGMFVQGGLWFDLLIAPALIWRRTRPIAVLASIAFHLTNAYLFNIGVFPWFMLAATTLFFEPSWPRTLPLVGPWIDRVVGPADRGTRHELAPMPRWGVGLVVAWFAIQVTLPLRHHLYPGDVAWTEEGHYMAWRMKLRAKSGSARFQVTDPTTGASWSVDPSDELSRWQVRKMLGKPDLILQYAHHLADRWKRDKGIDVEVRAQINVSLNGRPRQLLIDPDVDLARERLTLGPSRWITPSPR